MSAAVAARTAGSGKRWLPGQLPYAPLAAATGTGSIDGGTGDAIGLKVEIFINSAWTDISSYVYYRGNVGAAITRGRADETAQVQPQTAKVVLNNRDGRFSARNPVSPYYGQLTRNTPIRISRLNNGIRRYRFYGEVPAWPTASDISGSDVTVTITAAGMLRRLRQGNQPLRSALFRAFTIAYSSPAFVFHQTATPVAYWPCEDGENSTQIASGLAGGTAMTVSGAPTFASDSTLPGSAALPQLNGSIWKGSAPPTTGATANSLWLVLFVPAVGDNDNSVVARMTTSGTVARLDLVYTIANAGTLTLYGYNAAGTQLFTSGPFGVNSVTGIPALLTMNLTPDTIPGSVDWMLNFGPLDLTLSGGLALGSVSGSLGAPLQITINPDGRLGQTVVGHVACQTAYDDGTSLFDALDGHNSEQPIIRYARLCGEQNVSAVANFGATIGDDPTVMGAQGIDTFGTLLQQCADALFTPMFECRDQMSLAFRSKSTMYNQAAKLTLDIAQHHLSSPLVPVDDDQLTRNDITASRTGGSSYELALTSGPMSTQPPPSGIGPYPYGYDLSLGSDSLLPDQAGWRLRFGTVDEARYPTIPVNVRYFAGNVAMTNALLTIDIGDRLDIINPPTPQFPPDSISQIVQGYSETLGIFEHDIVFNCSPASPWNVGFLDDSIYGHADTDGSTLFGDYPLGTETTLRVATTGSAAGSSLWTTSAGDFPFDIAVGGERMTVTNITGAASPQTFTVTRSVNTVVKSQTSGTDVRLWQPMYTSV